MASIYAETHEVNKSDYKWAESTPHRKTSDRMYSHHNPFCSKQTQKFSAGKKWQRKSSRKNTEEFPCVRDRERWTYLGNWNTDRNGWIKDALVQTGTSIWIEKRTLNYESDFFRCVELIFKYYSDFDVLIRSCKSGALNCPNFLH